MKSWALALTGSILVILLAACVNAMDSEIRAFMRFREASAGDLAGAYDKLPDSQKVTVFFGAMKMHPPSDEIDMAVSKQSVAFLLHLRNEIERRNGFVEAYALNNAVIWKLKRKELTLTDVDSLKLPQLCEATHADQAVCAAQINLMR